MNLERLEDLRELVNCAHVAGVVPRSANSVRLLLDSLEELASSFEEVIERAAGEEEDVCAELDGQLKEEITRIVWGALSSEPETE